MDDLKNKPGIMLVLPDLEYGDVAYYCVDLAIALNEFGFRPVVVSAGGILLKELIRVNITHVQLPVNSCDFFKIYNNIKAITKIITDMNISVVHVNSRAAGLSCLYACKRTGAKLVTTVHSIYKTRLYFLNKIFDRAIIKSHSIIMPSLYVANYMVKYYNLESNKISIIHKWINPKFFSSEAISTERIVNIANTLAIPEDKRLISVIESNAKMSDLSLLIDSISELKRNDIAVFIMWNKNMNKSHLINKIKLMKMNDYINIIDHDIDAQAVYSLSDVVINLSSKYDVFNLEMLKVESIGRVIISTDQGASKEIIADGKTGKIIQLNTHDLSSAINWALNLSDEERRHISNEASKYVYFNFSHDSKISDVLSLYKSLL